MAPKKSKKIKPVRVKDKEGNVIISQRHDKNSQSIFIKLKGESKKRLMGIIYRNSRVFEIRRQRGKHLHYTSNTYGFNYIVLNGATLFDTIILIDEYGRYSIPRKRILQEGSFLNFKKAGFELQIFFSIEEITKLKTS